MATAQILSGLLSDQANRDQFASKTAEEVLKEPTLFYLMRSKSENNSKFRQAACQTVTTLLENSDMIAKWQYILEKRGNTNDNQEIQSEGLGLFLRLMHYYAVTLIETETEFSML